MPPKHQVFHAVTPVELLPYYYNNNDNAEPCVNAPSRLMSLRQNQDQFCSMCLLIQSNDIRQLISLGGSEVVSLWSEVKRDSLGSQVLFMLTSSREASRDCVKSQNISASSSTTEPSVAGSEVTLLLLGLRGLGCHWTRLLVGSQRVCCVCSANLFILGRIVNAQLCDCKFEIKDFLT